MTSWSWVPLTTIPGLPHQLTANFPYRIWGTTWSCSSQKSKIIQAYNFHFNCNPPLPPKWLLLGPPMHVDPYSSQHPNAGTQHANVMYIKNVALILDSFDKKIGHLLQLVIFFAMVGDSGWITACRNGGWRAGAGNGRRAHQGFLPLFRLFSPFKTNTIIYVML